MQQPLRLFSNTSKGIGSLIRSLDFTALKRRRREAMEKALQLGEVAIEPERNTLSAVSKNPYMPILICAPSSVVTNWVTDLRYVYSFRKRRDYFLAAIIMLILLCFTIVHGGTLQFSSSVRKTTIQLSLSFLDWRRFF